jgi:hypothetical protein
MSLEWGSVMASLNASTPVGKPSSTVIDFMDGEPGGVDFVSRSQPGSGDKALSQIGWIIGIGSMGSVGCR